MAIVTANSLAEAIRDLGLLTPEQLDEVSCQAETCTGPRELALRLLQRDLLTAFQINQLLQGRSKNLLIGPYVLIDRIGAGGMGEVYKARHQRLRRMAAVKVINREKVNHSAALKRFVREVEVAAQLSHPNIVAVYDAGEEGDTHFLAMEYIDGIDLGRLLLKCGPLPVPLACDFVRQTALGLEHAHSLGVVHRDIKPPNLLAAPRGGMAALGDPIPIERFQGATIKLLDMGLVRLQSNHLEDTALALTKMGVVIGTLDYLAPEQARNSHRVDHRADLYSLGCTLYHLLTGQPPFPGDQPLDKLLRHQCDEPTPIRAVRPAVSAELEGVLKRLMAKEPENRYASAAEAATALASCMGRAAPTRVVQIPPLPLDFSSTSGVRQRVVLPVMMQDTTEDAVVLSLQEAVPLSPTQARAGGEWWWWVAAGVVVLITALTLAGKLLLTPGTQQTTWIPGPPYHP